MTAVAEYVGRHRMPEPDDTDTLRLKIVRSVRDLFAVHQAADQRLFTHPDDPMHGMGR